MSESEAEALKRIRTFAILAIGAYSLALIAFFAMIYYLEAVIRYETVTKGVTLGVYSIFEVGGPSLPIVVSFSVAFAILLLLSFVYLRSGYGVLKSTSDRFNSPYAGINIYFAGLVVVVLGASIILARLVGVSNAPLVDGIIIVNMGGLISLPGEIFGLILGSMRLRDHFKRSNFLTAGVLFIVGLFLAPFSLIGAILIYRETDSMTRGQSRDVR